MAQFFISHSSQDKEAAKGILAGLREHRMTGFLDIDPEHGIRPGEKWEQVIYDRIDAADAVIALCSAVSVKSQWCFAEIAIARQLGKNVFPVILEEGCYHPLLKDAQAINLPRDGKAAFDGLWSQLEEQYRSDFEYDSQRSPYPGLRSFDEEDGAVFFGREAEVEDLFKDLERQAGAYRCIGVVGPSGSGKSSLVRAGLLPWLKKRDLGDRWVVVPRIVPGSDPVDSLARSLARAFRDRGRRRDPEVLGRRLAGGPAKLVAYAKDLLDASPKHPTSALLFIDQAEELVTLAGPEARTAFLKLLQGALDAKGTPLRAVITMRSEFLSTSPSQAGVAELIDKAHALEVLAPSRLAEVIARPAEKARLRFDPGLVERMVADTAGGDALPLLAFTLRELSDRSRERGDRRIRWQDYEAIDGVEGALRTQADAVWDWLRREGLGELVLPTLMKLATVEGESEPTRRRLPRSALSEAENQVVQAFVDEWLLISKQEKEEPDPKREDPDAVVAVEVAHEALLRQWPPLRKEIEDHRAELRIRGDLERLAQDWDRADRRESYLLRGDRLEEFQRWAASKLDIAQELPLVAEFLDTSSRSDEKALEGYSEAVARRALAVVDEDPEQCLLLALAAIEDYAPTPLAHQALMAALATPAVHTVLRGHQDAIWGVAWSPDGKCLATGSDDRDGTARVWDAERGEELAVLRGHTAGVMGVAWAPDSRHLATSSRDKTVRVWDAASGAELTVLRGHQEAVWRVAFSPDGRWLATAAGETEDFSARIWDAGTGDQVVALGHEDWVEGVAWSPDGHRLATASGDHTVRVWDAVSGAELAVLRGHQDQARGVAWSPDGRRLASVSYDKTLRVWDAASGAELAVLRGHQDAVRAVAWSPDGRRLATTSKDGSARIWAPDGPPELVILPHREPVRDLAWSPDGRRLATGTHDRIARIWDANQGIEVAVLRGLTDHVNGVAWSPDGRLATACSDRFGRVWDITDSSEPAVSLLHEQAVTGMSWSPDGRSLASASADGTVRLWDLAGVDQAVVLRGHRAHVRAVTWSPDGGRLASASRDRTVRIWDVESTTQIAMLGDPEDRARGHGDWVEAVAWSPDGGRLASASYDRTVRIWDVTSRNQVAVLGGQGSDHPGHEKEVLTVAWSPDGRFLASASVDATVRVWDTDSWAESAVLRGHESAVQAVAWSPDGIHLASAGEDRTVRVWQAANQGAPPGEWKPVVVGVHRDAVLAVAWWPDGRWLATASRDRTARIWDAVTYADTRALVENAESRVHRRLNQDEQNQLPSLGRRHHG